MEGLWKQRRKSVDRSGGSFLEEIPLELGLGVSLNVQESEHHVQRYRDTRGSGHVAYSGAGGKFEMASEAGAGSGEGKRVAVLLLVVLASISCTSFLTWMRPS